MAEQGQPMPWWKQIGFIIRTAKTMARIKVSPIVLCVPLFVIGVARLWVRPWSFKAWSGDTFWGYCGGLTKAAFPLSLTSVSSGLGGVMFAALSMLVLAIIVWWRHPQEFKQHITRNILYAAGASVIAFIPFAGLALVKSAFDQQNAVVQAGRSAAPELEKAKQQIGADKERIKALRDQTDDLSHNIYTSEPIFSNVTYLVAAFTQFGAVTLKPTFHNCEIRFSAPKETYEFAKAIATLSSAVSSCTTDGPWESGFDPDRDNRESSGMIANKILFHMARGDGAADGLFNALRPYLPLQRQFDGDYSEPKRHDVWFQFDRKVEWTIKEFIGGVR